VKKYLMGIDNGGTMTKAAIFDVFGNEIATCVEKTPLIVPQAGWQERDMYAMWQATVNAIKKALAKSGVDSGDIIGVGCTGHGKGLYLWGKDGKPSYNAISSTDSRAEDIVKEWRASGIADEAKKRTLQRVLACQPAALLAWFKANKPEVLKNTRWIFEAKDYIRFMLTGEAFAEVTDYSGTSLMNLHTKQFDRELLRLYGVEEVFDMLPPLRYSYERCGAVTREAGELTGLKEGTPVSGGMFDIDACAIAMDVSSEDKLCVITGTWSINEYISETPVSPDSTTLNSLFCIPGYYLIEESSPTSAGNLEWIADTFIKGRLPESAGMSPYRYADMLVASLSPEQSDTLFLPFLYGTNAEGVRSSAFARLNNSYELKHLLRAVFEGVAFSHKSHVDKLLKLRKTLKAVRLAGGVARSPVWTRIFADVLALPVEVIGAKELGAFGSAMSAALCAGYYDDYRSAAKNMVNVLASIEPDVGSIGVYERKYRDYLKLIDALSNIF